MKIDEKNLTKSYVRRKKGARMDQYLMNEHKLEYCVCGSDFVDEPCECGYYKNDDKREEKNEQHISKITKSKS